MQQARETNNEISNFWNIIKSRYNFPLDPVEFMDILKPTRYIHSIKLYSQFFTPEVIKQAVLPESSPMIILYMHTTNEFEVETYPEGSHGQFGEYLQASWDCMHPVHKYLQQHSNKSMELGKNYKHGISYGIISHKYVIGQVKLIIRYIRPIDRLYSTIHPDWNYDQIFYNITKQCIEQPEFFNTNFTVDNLYDLKNLVSELDKYTNLPVKITYENNPDSVSVWKKMSYLQ